MTDILKVKKIKLKKSISFITPKYEMFIALIKFLFTNKNSKNII